MQLDDGPPAKWRQMGTRGSGENWRSARGRWRVGALGYVGLRERKGAVGGCAGSAAWPDLRRRGCCRVHAHRTVRERPRFMACVRVLVDGLVT